MAATIWKGQLTFGLVSFPVRLQKAARRERIASKYVREMRGDSAEEPEPFEPFEQRQVEESKKTPLQSTVDNASFSDAPSQIVPVRQGYFSEGQRVASTSADLQHGYQIAPDTFVVVRSEELKSLRKATSPDMQILRSVRMQEIDPVFLETSYYVIPGPGGERSYNLFYCALHETGLAALAQVAMHGREHVLVLRAGSKGLIAHTMFYANEVRGAEEYVADREQVIGKELEMARRYLEALMEPFNPEEFTDVYREQLQALITSKDVLHSAAAEAALPKKATGKIVDIMDALRKSLETAKAAGAERKPVASAVASDNKPRKRKA